MRVALPCLTLVSLALIGTSFSNAEDWPQFRGPRGDGTSADENVPTEWSDSQNLKWKLKLPGEGFSSPIVVGERVFVTAFSGSGRDVTRSLVCVDRDSGKELWSKSVQGVSDGGDGGFANHGQASHTPVSDGQRVYAMFGSSGVIAYDMAGEELWRKSVGNERRSQFGTAASPILHGNLLIVAAGAESESIRAFHKETGEELWKAEAADLSESYCTPLLVDSGGGKALLLSVVNEIWSLNADTGKLNWYASTRVDTAACPSVVAHDGIAYVIGGRGGGRTAVRLGGEDEVTDSHVVWSERGGSYVPSPVLHQDRLYWINDRGIATCVDVKTGEEVANKRLGGRFYASIVLIGDKLYAQNRDGGMHVLRAGPEFEQISLNELSDDSDFSGSPAVSDGQLFIRSNENLYCIAAD